MNTEKLPGRIEDMRAKIEKDAKSSGLDPFDTVFYIVNYGDMNQLISYEGFPRRYPHWTHGMKSIMYENQYRYGLAKFFELVINTDYCNAFLLKNNSDVMQRFVISHVYGHSDFFKNNFWFRKTNRDMLMDMTRNAERIEYYERKYGKEQVESFLDRALTFDNLIDPYSPFKATDFESLESRIKEKEDGFEKPKPIETGDPYVDKMLNTPERYEKEMKRISAERKKREGFPRKPQKDVLKFLIDNSKYSNPNLKDWKIDILRMMREEAYYFAAQRMTKIMNEGWASYWHHHLMAEKGHAGDEGIFEFSKVHSSVVSPKQEPGPINPYSLGLCLFRWIEERWDKGRHGVDYGACDNFAQLEDWDTGDMKGQEKIFHVRKYYNDILFINEFMDQEFCNEFKLFKYGQDEMGRIIIVSKDANLIKKEIISQIYNGGEPLISVKDGNYENKGELLLYHDFYFNWRMLDMDKSLPVLRNIRHLWGRDVSIETRIPDGEDGKSARKLVILCTESTFVGKLYDGEGKEIGKKEFSALEDLTWP
ncbi:MAG: SpoVR family protein [Candidatus Woesearchaeota archaeon]